jgi:signal transduction histidine kinase
MSTEIFEHVKYLARPVPSQTSEKQLTQSPLGASLDYIVEASEVAAQSARMSYKLKTLVTIVWEYGSELERDDHYGITGYMRPTCETFRYYSQENNSEKMKSVANTPLCKECDRYHIDLLRAMINRNEFTQQTPDYFSTIHRDPQYHDKRKVPYLEYRCPMLGYTELLFPVRVDGKFLGAVFVGQILRESDSYAQDIFEDFLERQVNNIDSAFYGPRSPEPQKLTWIHAGIQSPQKIEYFRKIEYLKKLRELEVTDSFDNKYGLAKALITQHHKLLSPEDYNDLVSNAIDLVSDWNHALKGIMIEKRGRYIRSFFKSASDEAERKCRELESKEPRITMPFEYAVILRDTLCNDMDKFGISCVRVFGFNRNPLSYSNKMEIVLSTNQDEMLNTAKRIESKLSFDYEGAINTSPDIKPDHPWAPKCSIALKDNESVRIFDNNFFPFISSISSKEKNDSITEDTHLAILYQKWMVLIEADGINNNLEGYALILKKFSLLMVTFLSRFELRLSKYVSDKYYLTLRMYRHECEHIARAIKSRVDGDFSAHFNELASVKSLWEKRDKNPDYELRSFIARVRSDNLISASDDIVENVRLITHMADTVALLTERIALGNLDRHEKRFYFDIRKDILLKWQKTQMNDLTQREFNKKIHIFSPSSFSPEVYHRHRLIDLVVFNLIDNALKYSHWGTNIRITLGGDTQWESSVVPITIENYGYGIEPDPKAFELFYRGSETEKPNSDNEAASDGRTHMDGDGLGLFIAKSISDMLELGLSYKSEPVSSYNLGLISSYKKRGEDPSLKNELENERIRLEESMREICNSDDFNPVTTAAKKLGGVSQEDLELCIKRPTYHVTFQFQIQKRSTVT